MKKALILYWHGLGDIIMLTPHLRHLYNRGYKTDLMCRIQTMESHLLDNCPYIDNLIEVESPWDSVDGESRSPTEFKKQSNINIAQFEKLRRNYDWSGISSHKRPFLQGHKIDITSKELGLEIEDRKLEVFISQTAKRCGSIFKEDDVYIFVHTKPPTHPYHNWDATEWIKENLPLYEILYSSDLGFDDINIIFLIAERAKHRVLSSSVFVHACEAMGCIIDAINYGRPDRKVWPLDQSKIFHIRENGKWIK